MQIYANRGMIGVCGRKGLSAQSMKSKIKKTQEQKIMNSNCLKNPITMFKSTTKNFQMPKTKKNINK